MTEKALLPSDVRAIWNGKTLNVHSEICNLNHHIFRFILSQNLHVRQYVVYFLKDKNLNIMVLGRTKK